MFWGGIKKVMAMSRPPVRRDTVGVDFSGSSLKLAHARDSLNNKRELVNILSRDIRGFSDEDISKAINSSFGELKLENPNVINTVSSNMVITKNVEVPSLDPREIREIINLQAGRHTPYSREEIIVDYIEIGSYKNSYTKILLVIVARNVVKRNFDILRRAGLRAEKLILAPEALCWSVPRMLKVATEDSPIAVIHIDDIFTDFSVIFRNKPVFIRSIPIGAQQLSAERLKYQASFVAELRRSLEAYQSEDIEKTPTALVFTGATEEIKNIQEPLNEALHLPMKSIPYFNNLLISEQAMQVASTARLLSFLNVIAPLFASEEMKINLIPEEVKLKKTLEDRGKELVRTGIFVLAIFVLLFFILLSQIYFKSAYLNRLDSRYKPINEEAGGLERDFNKIGLVKGYLASRGFSLEVLTEIYNIAPDGIELSNIRFNTEGNLSIRGTADSMPTVFAFVESMEKSDYFKEVKNKYTTKRKDGMRDVTDFEITSLLSKKRS